MSDSIPIHNNKINLGSMAGVAVYADSMPPPTADPDGRSGWYFAKTGGAEKFNYYFYSQGSHAMTVADLEDVFFVGSINHWDSSQSCPFVVVYTKPTGNGDAGAWYHSRRAYAMASNAQITLGLKTQFSISSSPQPKFPYQHILLSNAITTGDFADDEEIYTISVQSDSASHNDTKILISNVGWRSSINNIVVNPNIKLVA